MRLGDVEGVHGHDDEAHRVGESRFMVIDERPGDMGPMGADDRRGIPVPADRERPLRDKAVRRLLRGQEELQRAAGGIVQPVGEAGRNDDGRPLLEVDRTAAGLDPPLPAQDEQKDLFAGVRETARAGVSGELGPPVGREKAQDGAFDPGIERIAPGQDIALGEPAVPFPGRGVPPMVDVEGDIRIDPGPAAAGGRVFPVRGALFTGGLLLAARGYDENEGQRREGGP